MPDTYLAFGSSRFPLGTSVQVISRGRTIGRSKVARFEGMRQTTGRRNGIEVQITVPLVRGPLDTSEFRPRRDALRAMMAVGPSRLFVGYDDRYYRCTEPEGEPEDILAETGLNRIHAVRMNIVGPDPYEYSTAEATNTWLPVSGTSRTVSTAGNADAAPVISITVGGSGLETIAFTVENETTGEEFTLTGDVTAGDVITVDSILHSVKIGTTDRMDLFNGLFLSLSPGSNTIVPSWTASSMTSITFAVRDRWE